MAGSIFSSSNFMVYDLVLLAAFAIFLGVFLYKRRKSVKREGLLLLYRTSWGIKLINKIGKKYKKFLDFMSYVSVTLGYLLMAGMIYLAGRIAWIYIFNKEIVQAVKVPPIMPLVPYLPQVFKLDFLPPFYFTYWIIIIAVIAITHEVAHGIFAAKDKIKIKTTGFGFFPFFLPIFLAAFVEPDEEQMSKSGIFKQLSVLSAGTFANVLTAIFFLLILIGFFSLAFSPGGVVFNDYAYNVVSISAITYVNGVQLQNPDYEKIVSLIDENKTFQDIRTSKEEYIGFKQVSSDGKRAALYYDAPAIRKNLESIILEINGEEVKSVEKLSSELLKYSPNETITLTLIGQDNEPYNLDITLDQHPNNSSLSWLGVGFVNAGNTGVINNVFGSLGSIKTSNVYYEPKFDGISLFVYNLLWWLILISISVAFINMLPVGIFDGGRFFYLTILGITKSESKARKFFAFSTYFFLFLLLLIMFFWIFSFN